jgi:hypothetical protein
MLEKFITRIKKTFGGKKKEIMEGATSCTR